MRLCPWHSSFALVLVTLVTAVVVRAGEPVEERPSAPPPFTSLVAPLDVETRAAMTGVVWRAGCPVPLDDLRRVTVRHHVEGGGTNQGNIVVHARIADDVAAVFGELYAQGFVVSRMEPIEKYAGDDETSMRANNTSGFNCREVTGKRGVFSLHAYGLALDVNPLVNPYVKGARVLPKGGDAYLDRTAKVPGIIVDDDATVRAFRARGFTWGGDFRSLKDWQHFERPRAILSSSSPTP